jgi:hypothetical protein
MGRVRVAGLAFSLEYLRSEIHTFQVLMQQDEWFDNLENRKAAGKGLTFIMLNLGCNVDEDAAWRLFHQVMDEYYDLCDQFHVTY